MIAGNYLVQDMLLWSWDKHSRWLTISQVPPRLNTGAARLTYLVYKLTVFRSIAEANELVSAEYLHAIQLEHNLDWETLYSCLEMDVTGAPWPARYDQDQFHETMSRFMAPSAKGVVTRASIAFLSVVTVIIAVILQIIGE